ncbi:MAG: hypothetical protein AAF442_08695 [Pseudomonadota bacterium]
MVLMTGKQFSKAIAVFEGRHGVGKTTGKVPIKLDAYHALLAKGQWDKLAPAMAALDKELDKYRKSANKTIAKARAAKKPDHNKISTIDRWENAVDELIANVRDADKQLQALQKDMKALKPKLKETLSEFNRLADNLDGSLDDSEITSEIHICLMTHIPPLVRALDGFVNKYGQDWKPYRDYADSLMALTKKDFSYKQTPQVIKIVKTALSRVPVS